LEVSLVLLQQMPVRLLELDAISYNSAISASTKVIYWEIALCLLQQKPCSGLDSTCS